MTKKEIIEALQPFPDDMPVNVHMEYKDGMILRCPGVVVAYLDSAGNIEEEPGNDVIEISLYVEEALLKVKKRLGKLEL